MERFNTYFLEGFTLAEVLITLGIVGVVAAMTLPAVINNAKNKELETSLKKNYSVMTQALQKMSEEYGETVTVSSFAGREFKQTFMKYFNVLRDCGFGTSDIKACVNNNFGSDGTSTEYMNYNRKSLADLNYWDDGQFIVNDGSLYLIENQVINKLYISVDVNGFKKPNVWGRDVFTFQLMSDGKLLPMGMPGTEYKSDEYCSPSSSSKFNGIGCTYKALTDKNFWK